MVMEPWGKVLDEVTRSGALLDNMTIMNKEGKVLLEQSLQPVYKGYPNTCAKRGQVQRSLLDYAISLGVEVNLGAPVVEVFESDVSAGVRIGDKLHEADCVVAGDGVRSKARAFVTGVADRPKKSGYAIYRTWFPLDVLRGDSILEGIPTCERAICKVWIAPESHALLTTNLNMQAATFFLTHKVCLFLSAHALVYNWALLTFV
jgi:2-polyprenyl-6-methoxyphenol hydroxylase-like FAD-dependent oxidoreductase